MIEVTGDLWTYRSGLGNTIRIITTNGTVKANGAMVMGRGCARQARDRFPGLDMRLGRWVKAKGNVPLICSDLKLMTFPVKDRWDHAAKLSLIRDSAIQLAASAGADPDTVYVLPRPGCGNGWLRWEKVKPVLEDVLPDNVHVITFGENL